MKGKHDKGSVLMECVLVMPILLFLILGIVQFSQIIVAKLLTHYAAYSAARAAIVYHPDDYRDAGGKFYPSSGPLHQAACIALARLGAAGDSAALKNDIAIPGWGAIEGSGKVFDRVRISGRDYSEASDVKDLENTTQVPAVEVTVTFEFPLLIPYAGCIIGMFAAGGDELKQDVAGYISSSPGSYKADEHNTITLKQSCIMARPWSTKTFPRAVKNK